MNAMVKLTASSKHQFLQRVRRLPAGEFLAFGIKQAWAALFGGLMLAGIIATKYIDLPWLSRYDWLFVWAIAIQLFMLLFRLEKPHEVITILLFHLVGLGMELFKTSPGINSWSYPGDAIFMVGGVPLFSGFMYAAVGSYIARSWRVMNLEFKPYPRRWLTVLLAAMIYINFFTHHYAYDIRLLLFAAVLALYGRTKVYFTVTRTRRNMPLILGFGLIALFIWIAENIGTYTSAWLYPGQEIIWHPVSLQKLGSWFLLMIISFIMVDMLYYLRTRKTHRHRKA